MKSFGGGADGEAAGVEVLLGEDSGPDVGLDEGVEDAADDGLASVGLELGAVVLPERLDVQAAPTRAMADKKPMAAERPVISQREV